MSNVLEAKTKYEKKLYTVFNLKTQMPFGGAQLSTNFFVLIFFPVLAFKTTGTQ